MQRLICQILPHTMWDKVINWRCRLRSFAKFISFGLWFGSTQLRLYYYPLEQVDKDQHAGHDSHFVLRSRWGHVNVTWKIYHSRLAEQWTHRSLNISIIVASNMQHFLFCEFGLVMICFGTVSQIVDSPKENIHWIQFQTKLMTDFEGTQGVYAPRPKFSLSCAFDVGTPIWKILISPPITIVLYCTKRLYSFLGLNKSKHVGETARTNCCQLSSGDWFITRYEWCWQRTDACLGAASPNQLGESQWTCR